jgi:hypothetical protein
LAGQLAGIYLDIGATGPELLLAHSHYDSGFTDLRNDHFIFGEVHATFSQTEVVARFAQAIAQKIFGPHPRRQHRAKFIDEGHCRYRPLHLN